MSEKKRNYNLDLFRFIMSIGIVWYHILHSNILPYLPEGAADSLVNACNGGFVEFFLLLGGFYLFQSLSRKENELSFYRFAAEKFARFWPVMAFQVVCLLLMKKESFGDAFTDLFLLRATGLVKANKGIVWYIGPYFWATLLLGGFYCVFGKKKTLFFSALLVFFGYGLNITLGGGLGSETVEPFIPLGMLRICAGLSLGFLYGALRERLPQRKAGLCGTVLYTVLEAALLWYLFSILFRGKAFSQKSLTLIVCFLLLIHCMLERKGLISRLLDRPWLAFPGKYGYSIYIMQQASFYLLIPFFWKAHPYFLRTNLLLSLIVSTGFSVCVGIVTYYLVEKPAKRILTKRLLRGAESAEKAKDRKKPGAAQVITAVFLCIFILAPLGLTLYSYKTEDTNYSYNEYRSLAQFEKPKLKTLLNGQWTEKLEAYNKDQFVFREKWIELYYRFRDAMGEFERNGYLSGKQNVYLSFLGSVKDPENYGAKQVSAMTDIAGAASGYGGKVIYMNAPHHTEFFEEYYPRGYENRASFNGIMRASIVEKAKAAGIPVVETYDVLKAHEDEYIYYITDHHWTIKGAWYAYRLLLEKIGELEGTPLQYPDWDELEHIPAEQQFLGSYWRSFGYSGLESPDRVEYAFPYDMPAYTRTDNNKAVNRPLYNKNDYAYTTYMGGDIANTVIETDRPELPSVLYIGLSYTNALEAMSVYNFDRVESLDPRHFTGNICEYVTEHEPDYIVIVRDDLYEGNSGNKAVIK